MKKKLLSVFLALASMLAFAPSPAGAMFTCDPGRASTSTKYVWRSSMSASPRFRVLNAKFFLTDDFGNIRRPYVETMYSTFGIYMGNDLSTNPYDMDVGIEFIFQLDGSNWIRYWAENSVGVNAIFDYFSAPDWLYYPDGDIDFTIYHDVVAGQESYNIYINGSQIDYTVLNSGVDAPYATVGWYGAYGSQFFGGTNANRTVVNNLFWDNDSPNFDHGWDNTTDRDDFGVESAGSWPYGQFGGREDFWDQNCP